MFARALATATDTSGNLTFSDVVAAWLGWITLAVIFYAVLSLVSAVLIYRKAGYSHWLGVIAVAVPLVGPIFVLVFAMLKWPALKERDDAVALLKKHGLALEAPKPAAGAGDAPVSDKAAAASSKELKKPTAP